MCYQPLWDDLISIAYAKGFVVYCEIHNRFPRSNGKMARFTPKELKQSYILLELSTNDAENVVTLAHEVGHILNKHFFDVDRYANKILNAEHEAWGWANRYVLAKDKSLIPVLSRKRVNAIRCWKKWLKAKGVGYESLLIDS